MRLTLLGTGAAGGVPLYGCHCPACLQARSNFSLRRAPCCALIEANNRRILIDAGLMDLSERFPSPTLDFILLTHFHADHVQGLFHLRWGVGSTIDVYCPNDTAGCADLYSNPGLLRFNPLSPFEPFQLCEIMMTPVPLNHSKKTFGFCLEHRGERISYLTDTCGLPDETMNFLKQWHPESVIIDCTHPPKLEPLPHNHNDLTTALALQKSIGNTRLILNHISHEFDSWLMEHPATLPESATLAYDGMAVV